MSGKQKRDSAAPVAPKSRDGGQRRSETSEESDDDVPIFQHWNPDQLEIVIDEENAYHQLELMDWWKFSPVAIKGILSVVKQLDGNAMEDLKYCQVAVSSTKKPTDATVRAMTYNGKRWIGHDLETPLKDIAKSDAVDPKIGRVLPERPEKPKACLKCLKRTRNPEESDSSDGDGPGQGGDTQEDRDDPRGRNSPPPPPVIPKKKKKVPKETHSQTGGADKSKRKKSRIETDSEPTASQNSSNRSQSTKGKSSPKKQKQATRSVDNASLNPSSKKDDEPVVIKKKKTKKPKVSSVILAQPTRRELEDVSAEETPQEAQTAEYIPPEEQEVFCRLPPSMPALHGTKGTERRQSTVEQPGPSEVSQRLQERRSRSPEKSERSSRENSSGSVTSKSG